MSAVLTDLTMELSAIGPAKVLFASARRSSHPEALATRRTLEAA